jgi:hypothetical protein
MSSRMVAILAAAFSLSLAAFAYSGSFARYVADDFCTNVELHSAGFFGAQLYWFTSWTGRFAFVLLIDALDSLGAWTVPLSPLVILTAWLAAVVASVSPVWERLAGSSGGRGALAIGLALITLTLGSSAGLWQSLYWQTGAVTYLVPIVLITAYPATLWRVGDWRRPPAWGWIGVGIALGALAVGCSETAMGMVVATLALATTTVTWHFRQTARHPGSAQTLIIGLATALTATLLASLVVVVAPGNAVRMQFLHRPDLLTATLQTAIFPFLVVARFVIAAPLYAVGAYVTPNLIGRLRYQRAPALARGRSRAWRRQAIACGGLIVAAAGAPAIYAGGELPPDRALIIPQYIMIATIMCCGLLDGLASPRLVVALPAPPTPKRVLLGTCVALALLVPLLTTAHTLLESDQLRAYAAAFDEREQEALAAHAAGTPSLAVAALDQPSMVGLAEPGADPEAWPNFCIASYYGLDTLTVSDRTGN